MKKIDIITIDEIQIHRLTEIILMIGHIEADSDTENTIGNDQIV